MIISRFYQWFGLGDERQDAAGTLDAGQNADLILARLPRIKSGKRRIVCCVCAVTGLLVLMCSKEQAVPTPIAIGYALTFEVAISLPLSYFFTANAFAYREYDLYYRLACTHDVCALVPVIDQIAHCNPLRVNIIWYNSLRRI